MNCHTAQSFICCTQHNSHWHSFSKYVCIGLWICRLILFIFTWKLSPTKLMELTPEDLCIRWCVTSHIDPLMKQHVQLWKMGWQYPPFTLVIIRSLHFVFYTAPEGLLTPRNKLGRVTLWTEAGGRTRKVLLSQVWRWLNTHWWELKLW